MESSPLREYATDAIKYWEPRRIGYNVILCLIVGAYFIAGLPASKRVVSVDLALYLYLLAVVANIAYCFAYVVDVFVQATALRETWRKRRWILYLAGLIFASILTRFFATAFFLPG